MRIEYGWSKEFKEEFAVGHLYCERCRSNQIFGVYSTYIQTNLQRVDFLKINNKHYYACSLCKYGKHLSRSEYKNLRSVYGFLPEPTMYWSLYNHIQANMSTFNRVEWLTFSKEKLREESLIGLSDIDIRVKNYILDDLIKVKSSR